jgi:hypothetical protein
MKRKPGARIRAEILNELGQSIQLLSPVFDAGGKCDIDAAALPKEFIT